MNLYAIRTVKIGKYPSHIQCPFEIGAYMEYYHNTYAGESYVTVYNGEMGTIFTNLKQAREALRICNEYNATFEIVIFEEVI